MAYEKPLPKVTREDRAFWQAAKEHRFLLPRCLDCGHVWFPPYLSCPRCASARIEWTEASGRGVIWGRIEMHQAYLKSFADVMLAEFVRNCERALAGQETRSSASGLALLWRMIRARLGF